MSPTVQAGAGRSGAISRLNVGTVHLSCDEIGSGDPILFIPGLIGLAAQWSRQLDYFGKKHRAIAFDHRGAGQSDKPMHEYTTSLLAEDAVALLDTLSIGQAHIVGASTGGAIAQVLALEYPSRVRSLTLVRSSAKVSSRKNRPNEAENARRMGLRTIDGWQKIAGMVRP